MRTVLNARMKRHEMQINQRRAEIYALGQLMMVAQHKPKKFPRPEEFMGKSKRRAGSSDAEIRAYFRALAARNPR